MARYILLCDLDAFYALVEQRDDPSLSGKPLIVGGRPETRGVVSTCSYEARAYGIRSAMPVSTALRLCPHVIIVEPDMAKYSRVSGEFFAILDSFTPAVEAVSIDEAYMEITGPEGSGVKTAQLIRRAVREELGITVSIGIAPNKLLAKISAELAKPDGFMEIPGEKAQEILDPLDVRVIPGIGEKTEERVKALGIRKVRDLRAMPESFFKTEFGSRAGVMMEFTRAIDRRAVETASASKSFSEETTFPRDISDEGALLGALLGMAETLGPRLRASGHLARTVTVKIRYEDFKTITRSRTLKAPVVADMEIYEAATGLFRDNFQGKRVRLLGIQVSNLVSRGESFLQQDFFEDEGGAERERLLSDTLDGLKRRFGSNVIKRAGRRR